MYKIPSCQITLQPFEPFQYAASLEVNSSWKNLTDTATLLLPKATHVQTGQKLTDTLKVGQTVGIEMGYNYALKPVFAGYISGIQPDMPFKLMLEDEMWQFKKIPFSGSWNQITLEALLAEMLASTGIKYKCAVNADLFKLRFEKSTVAKVLQFLKEKRGLYSFFRNGILYVGTPNIHATFYDNKQTIEYVFQRDVASSSLEWKQADDRHIKVEAISVLPNNKELKATVGDEGGEVHTLHFYNIESEAELKRMAEAEMPKLRISGYKGSFTAFPSTIARHGDVAEIFDIDFPERSGKYRIDGVVSRFGNGLRQDLTLGIRVK